MLSEKHILFCNEYLIDFNASAAFVRAGYAEKGARQNAYTLLQNDEIKEYLSKQQEKLQRKTEISAERVINELAKIAFHNTQDFVNGGNSVLEIKHLDRDKVAAVSKIKTTTKEFDGNVTTTTEIGFYDKVDALEKLGRHLGVFEKDNTQKQPNTNIVIPEQVSKAIDKLLDDAL